MATVVHKRAALDKAIEIAKNYGRGGCTELPEHILDSAYRKIVELMDDSEKDS